MTTHQIDLEKYRTPRSKIFTGRDRGLEVRELSKIDELVNQYDNIEIIIPDTLYAINPSFFEEFLVNIVKALGEKDFYNKVVFRNNSSFNYVIALKEAITRILRKKTALDK